jgi:hypothetical protein
MWQALVSSCAHEECLCLAGMLCLEQAGLEPHGEKQVSVQIAPGPAVHHLESTCNVVARSSVRNRIVTTLGEGAQSHVSRGISPWLWSLP